MERAMLGTRTPIVSGGEILGHWDKPDNALLRFLLAHRLPARYGSQAQELGPGHPAYDELAGQARAEIAEIRRRMSAEVTSRAMALQVFRRRRPLASAAGGGRGCRPHRGCVGCRAGPTAVPSCPTGPVPRWNAAREILAEMEEDPALLTATPRGTGAAPMRWTGQGDTRSAIRRDRPAPRRHRRRRRRRHAGALPAVARSGRCAGRAARPAWRCASAGRRVVAGALGADALEALPPDQAAIARRHRARLRAAGRCAGGLAQVQREWRRVRSPGCGTVPMGAEQRRDARSHAGGRGCMAGGTQAPCAAVKEAGLDG